MLSGALYILSIMINCLIAVYDFSFYRIPNILVLALFFAFVCVSPFILSFDELLMSLGIFAAALAAGFFLFFFGIFGGGDAKYLATCAMWAGSEHLLTFLLIVSLVGGALAVMYLVGQSKISIYSTNVWNRILLLEKRFSPFQYVWAFSGNGPETHKREAIKQNHLPYGIAISAGMIAVLYMKLTT